MDHKKTNENDHSFLKEFEYKHDNPYHDKLAAFDGLVFRDLEGEKFKGEWRQQVFHNNLPLEVEIGTGYGHFMLEYCQKNPNINFIGMDHRFKRSYQVARKLQKLENKNFRYLRARGERIEFIFGENELSKVFYFFPDPWPKTRHHKKRLFQKAFLNGLYTTLMPGGEIFIKTDHDEYFDWMCNYAEQDQRFEITFKSLDLYGDRVNHFLASFQTKFEKIFLEQQVKIKVMVLKSLKR